jgi:mannitol 2-dehydrogenase
MQKISRLRPDVGLPLTNATLQLHSDRLAVPTYDRSALVPSVVHIGVGGFHRAHQAVYLDDLARQRISGSWGITGVGLHRRQMKEVLSAQDCLYTLVERGAGVERGRVVGSLCRYLYAPEESQQVCDALADARTRIVTLTITGNGYQVDRESPAVGNGGEAVRVNAGSGLQHETVWGYLTAALDRRRRSGKPPFTVLSCDNMPDNGDAARKALVGFAELRDPRLARWIDENVAFPSTMVDRITPKTSPHDRDAVERTFGVADRWPVITEPFHQWIVEDTFCNGRPPLEEVGVEVVTNVANHKLVKTRLLNGVHCAIGYLGILAGYHRTAQAMADPLIYRYVEAMMRDEISPLLPAVPGWDINDYRVTILNRLTNPRITDSLSRLAARGTTKMPSYLLPSLHEARARGVPDTLLTLAVAAWIRYLRGYDFHGKPIMVEDRRASQLTTMAKLGQNNPCPLLESRDIFGDLGDDPCFVARVSEVLKDFERIGIRNVLRNSVAQPLTHAIAR